MRAFAMLFAASTLIQAQSQSDAPKRTIFDSQQTQKRAEPPASPSAKPAAPARDPGSSAFDALISTSENLNVIRDSNVRRLTDGCQPDVAARVADLRARLGIKTTAAKHDSGVDTAALALASDWIKSPVQPAAASTPEKKSELLDAVIPGAEKKSPTDKASLQAELDRLLASCAGGRK